MASVGSDQKKDAEDAKKDTLLPMKKLKSR